MSKNYFFDVSVFDIMVEGGEKRWGREREEKGRLNNIAYLVMVS
jgi:hypothetical protein